MIFTPNYKLGSVVAGESLIPIEDSRRFLTIDRQLLGLFQVFGNGVVSGWDVTDGGGLNVAVSPGTGHVSFISGATTDVNTVTLTPNAVNYIYAQAIETTRFDRNVRFFSDVSLFNSGAQILLAKVTTNDSSVVSIDETVRNDISFIAEIKALINQHRHRGGPDNPTKVDLTQEVMGQLPGFHIDAIDASKVASGILPLARIPLLEHNDLLDSGVLSHAQLDSFVRSLSNPDVRLLGELSATNLLQLYLAFKHIWNDVDAFTTNMIVEIPGITPDSFTDFKNSTAVIDKDNHLIQGVPSLGGQLVATTFRTDADFASAVLNSNINIGTDINGDFFNLVKPFTEQVVESFDNVFQNALPIPGWTVETVPSANSTSFTTDSTQQVDGPFSAKLNVAQQVRLQVTKLFTTTADWTSFNEIQASIETLSPSHGKIIFQTLMKDSSGNLVQIDAFTLLQANETTVGFKQVTRDITGVTRNKVDAIRIYTDTALGWNLSDFIVNLDHIVLNNNLFFDASGRLRFRLKTPQPSHWAAIGWVATLNGGTVQARARTAPSYETFDQSNASVFSSFSDVVGADPKVPDNRAIEIEIAITAAPGLAASPVVRSVSVSYITNSVSNGITIDTVDGFLRATRLENAAVVIPGEVVIDGRIDTGDVVYGIQHSIQQVSLSTSDFGVTYGTPVVGIDGTSLPLSPIQVVQNNLLLKESALNGVAEVKRQIDRSYLAADTINDRIVVFGRDGSVITALASNNIRNQTDLYPVSVVYNPANRILYIAWSTNVSLNNLDLSKMEIDGAGLSITLSNTADKVVRLAGVNNENQSANVSPILLSPVHADELNAFFGDSTNSDQRIFMNIDPTAAKEGINSDNANFAALVGPRGFPIFVGNFQFVVGLFRPISVNIMANGNWLVGNAKPLLTGSGNTDPVTGVGVADITSVIEIDPLSGAIVSSDNSVDFSLLTLGGAIEMNSRYIAVAGIVEGSGPPTQKTTTSLVATVGGGVTQTTDSVTTTTTSAATATSSGTSSTGTTTTKSDVDVLTSRIGIVKIIEKASGRVVFQQPTSDGTYAADIQLDAEGEIVTIEKSFANGTSTGRVIKLDEDGNIFFEFGLAELASPNDVRVLSTGNMIVST